MNGEPCWVQSSRLDMGTFWHRILKFLRVLCDGFGWWFVTISSSIL